MAHLLPSLVEQSKPIAATAPRLKDRVRDVMRVRHYSLRTERTYWEWIERFIRFHRLRHPREMAESEVVALLTHLAREKGVTASTQNQALAALLFFYKEVLRQEFGWLEGLERARKPARVPVVLTQPEVAQVLARLIGTSRLMGACFMAVGCV